MSPFDRRYFQIIQIYSPPRNFAQEGEAQIRNSLTITKPCLAQNASLLQIHGLLYGHRPASSNLTSYLPCRIVLTAYSLNHQIAFKNHPPPFTKRFFAPNLLTCGFHNCDPENTSAMTLNPRYKKQPIFYSKFP